MALWVCNRCGCEFAVGLRMCPQCTAEDCHEYGPEDEMAKISKAQGPSYREGEAGWDGNSSSTSTAPEQTSTSNSEPLDPSPAPTTENPSQTDQTAGTASSADGSSQSTPAPADPSDDGYDEMLNADLEQELEDRGLSKTGNKAEMIARLREADAAASAADQAGQ